IYNVDYCASALAFRIFLSDACSRFVEGVAAMMLAGEAQAPGLYGRIADNLRRQFGLEQEALDYWYVHDKADDDHGDAGRQILDRFVKTDAERQLVIQTASSFLDISSLMFDEVWSHASRLH